MTVGYAGGQSLVLGPSYFTLDSDGLSLDGEQLSTLSGYPTGLFDATSAILTGRFSTQNLTLNDGTTTQVFYDFTATISDSSGLSDGDLAIINATTTPEPATWMMLATGLLFGSALVVRQKFLTRKGIFRASLCICFALLLLSVAAKAQSTVKLNSVTSPSSGSAGTSTVNVTGSGFPSGAISPANVLVSISATCGGGSPATVAASTVQTVIGTTDKVGFLIPGSLTAGTYGYVSISGTSASEISFTSSTCSTLQVVGGASPTLTINATNPTDWVISNGALTIDYNSQSGAIWSVVPTGTQDQLVDFSPGNATVNGVVYDPADGESAIGGTSLPAGWSGPSGIPNLPATFANKQPKGFYMDSTGFGAVTPTPGYNLTTGYLDWWTTFPSSSTGTTNAFTYEEHFVVTPNDTGIHLYFVANHAATDPTGSMGQVQWIFRDNVNTFTNLI